MTKINVDQFINDLELLEEVGEEEFIRILLKRMEEPEGNDDSAPIEQTSSEMDKEGAPTENDSTTDG